MSFSISHICKILGILIVLLILSPGITSRLSEGRAPAQERKYEVKTFKGLPVTVNEVRNLQKTEDWFRDLEIVVKNISDQPIYFISLSILFPDIPPPANMPENSKTGFSLKYGRPELGTLWNLARPEDVPIKPGETYTFTIPEGYVTGLENMKQTWYMPPGATNKIVIRFNAISFGDGTGFTGSGVGGKRDYRGKRPLISKSGAPSGTCQTPILPDQLLKTGWNSNGAKTNAATTDAATVLGCSSGNCWRWRIDFGGALGVVVVAALILQQETTQSVALAWSMILSPVATSSVPTRKSTGRVPWVAVR